MTPASLHDLFFAAAGVSGALIGLLFVALSVERDRLTADDADQVARVRARAALTAFTNALGVSLWALIPGSLGTTSIAFGAIGLLFICASLLSVRRVSHSESRRRGRVRDLAFLILQAAVFGLQIWRGILLTAHSHDSGAADSIADLVIVCLLFGIYRSWELIGGPDVDIAHELRSLVSHETTERPDRPE